MAVEASQNRASGLDPAPIHGFDEALKQELLDAVGVDLEPTAAPVALDGLVSAWCWSASLTGGLLLTNIVATVRARDSGDGM